MSSALACVGLVVSDGSELERTLKSVYPDVREIGFFDRVHVGRWHDGSGATLILGLHGGEIVDFATTYTSSSGGLLADCWLIYESIAFAKVTDTDGQQLTTMAFEAEQYRQMLALGQRVSRPAQITDDAGFCPDCAAPYCYRHWHVSETRHGSCPQGHGKSLDLHWSP